MKKEEESGVEDECAVVEWRKAPPGVDINACIRERDPEAAPDAVGLRRMGHPIQRAIQWITETGAPIRDRLTPRPSMAPVVQTGPYESPMSGTARFLLAAILLVEILLLWSLQE